MRTHLLVHVDELVTNRASFASLTLRPGAFAGLGACLALLNADAVLVCGTTGEVEARLGAWLQQETGRSFTLVHTPADAQALGADRRIVLVSDDLPAVTGATNLVLPDPIQWAYVPARLRAQLRRAHVHRKTNETDIRIELALEGTGASEIQTGLGFFDHMLDQIARHGGLDLTIHTQGDLHIDEHHTVEDTALALGQAFHEALGDKRGLARYGFTLPMDDALAQVAIDFGGRPWLVWDATFTRERIGDVPTELFSHFFKSFSDAARCNLNIQARGTNEHHLIESIFKAFARAIRMAVKIEGSSLPSTKGVL